MLKSLLIQYWVYLLLPIGLLVGWAIGRRSFTGDQNTVSSLNNEYFKGFNYLLNEQSDKAVEVFVKALEVDSETVELHLALGGLFRREGQVGRATRIHQNIIARPYLTDEQNKQAVFELAQDYMKAGLYDRAENLFLELIDRSSFQDTAQLALLSIYESEKDWRKAIAIAKKMNVRDYPDVKQRLAHYWCELATVAIEAKDYDEAKKHLRQSLYDNPASIRRMVMEGDLQYAKGDVRKAVQQWRLVQQQATEYADLVQEKLFVSLQQSGDKNAVSEFLQQQLNNNLRPATMQMFADYHGHSAQAYQQLFACVGDGGSREAVLWLLRNKKNLLSSGFTLPSAENMLNLFEEGFNINELSHNPYVCVQCGFESKVINWQCPSCKAWEKQSRIN